jgi:hypothetical protein
MFPGRNAGDRFLTTPVNFNVSIIRHWNLPPSSHEPTQLSAEGCGKSAQISRSMERPLASIPNAAIAGNLPVIQSSVEGCGKSAQISGSMERALEAYLMPPLLN